VAKGTEGALNTLSGPYPLLPLATLIPARNPKFLRVVGILIWGALLSVTCMEGQTAVAFVNNEAPEAKAEKANDDTPHWYTPLKKPDWWVVGIALVTLAVLYKQAKEMERATRAMERSSGVLMDTEQGRIVTYWEKMIHLDASRKGVHDGALSHRFNWAVGNIGKTQAEVTKLWARFVAVKSLGDLPQKPDYSARNEIVYQGEPLQPSSTKKPQSEWFSTPLETALSYVEMEAKHRQLGCFLYAYAYVRYVDIWGRPHETRFGIVRDAQPTLNFQLDTWVVAGPPEYNRST
jgi:hypothetical protein